MTTPFFVTGTDTDIGKTLVSAALLHKAHQNGQSSFGLKPVAAGCELNPDDTWQNEDALLLRQYSSVQFDYSRHNPIALKAAIAPHIAAEYEQQSLTVESLVNACDFGLNTTVDFRLVEGAGGWLVPLNDIETLADFATAIQARIILVVGLRLGCINHALLTAQQIQARELGIAGWVANHIDPDMEAQSDNLHFLTQWFEKQSIPLLGRVPFLPELNRENPIFIGKVADYLQLPNDG